MLEAGVLGWAHVRRILEVEDALAAPAWTIEVIFKDLIHFHVLHVIRQIHAAWIAAKSLIWCTAFSEIIASVRSLEEIAFAEKNDIARIKYLTDINHALVCQVLPIIVALLEGCKANFMW